MSYAIVGTGNVGKALASAFARKGFQLFMASRKPVEVTQQVTKSIGPTIVAKSLQDAVKADIVLLAVPFGSQTEVAKSADSWEGKIVIDVTNAYGVSPEDLGNLPSSSVVARAFPGAYLVKAFNHLPAKTLAEDPEVEGGKRVIFLSGDDEASVNKVAAVVEALGFSPVSLGKLTEGGLLIQARGKTWAPLIFQDLVKFK